MSDIRDIAVSAHQLHLELLEVGRLAYVEIGRAATSIAITSKDPAIAR